jgi:hypothetical protein
MKRREMSRKELEQLISGEPPRDPYEAVIGWFLLIWIAAELGAWLLLRWPLGSLTGGLFGIGITVAMLAKLVMSIARWFGR